MSEVISNDEAIRYMYDIVERLVDEYAESLDTVPYENVASDQKHWNDLSAGFLESVKNRLNELSHKNGEIHD